MRQIHVCAWLLFLSACGGEAFSSDGVPTTAKGGRSSTTAGATNNPGAAANGSSGTSVDISGGAFAGIGGAGGSKLSMGAAGPHASGEGGEGGESAPDSGGSASEDCATGAITFRMLPGPSLAPDYLCDAGCGTGWLSITDADGAAAFSIFPACGTASCDSCEVQKCMAAACLATPLTAKGSELVWYGTYLEKDKCGTASMVCQRQACVKPGKYKARACAALNTGVNSMNGGCMPKDEQLCAEAEFEFPATKTVPLVLTK
jgi:hypothetical protein